MIRVAILGATGYTALELIKLLLRHPEVEITALTSRSEGSPHVASVHPQLAGRIDLPLADLGPTDARLGTVNQVGQAQALPGRPGERSRYFNRRDYCFDNNKLPGN